MDRGHGQAIGKLQDGQHGRIGCDGDGDNDEQVRVRTFVREANENAEGAMTRCSDLCRAGC